MYDQEVAIWLGGGGDGPRMLWDRIDFLRLSPSEWHMLSLLMATR